MWKGVSPPDFGTLEGYVKAVATHGEDLTADIPAYTNITSVFQVNELVADESR